MMYCLHVLDVPAYIVADADDGLRLTITIDSGFTIGGRETMERRVIRGILQRYWMALIT